MVLRDELAHNFFAESLSTKPENGLQWNSSNSQEVQRALLLAMEGKYSKNLQTSLRTTGLGLDHHWIARGRFNILVINVIKYDDLSFYLGCSLKQSGYAILQYVRGEIYINDIMLH
ncbi:hypothetical protein ACS0TY_035404 [Phlomoides rotata]